MPPNEKLEAKVEDILLDRIPNIEVRLGSIEMKQDLIVEKLDGLSGEIREHMKVHQKHGERIMVLETAEGERKEVKSRRRTIKTAVMASSCAAAVAAVVGFVLKMLWA